MLLTSNIWRSCSKAFDRWRVASATSTSLTGPGLPFLARSCCRITLVAFDIIDPCHFLFVVVAFMAESAIPTDVLPRLLWGGLAEICWDWQSRLPDKWPELLA